MNTNTYKRLHDIRDGFYYNPTVINVENFQNSNTRLSNHTPNQNVSYIDNLHRVEHFQNPNTRLTNNMLIQNVSYIDDLHRIEHFEETKNPNENKDDLSFKTDTKTLEMKIETSEGILSSPDIFGPPFWFTLHASSMSYSFNPTPIIKEKMRNFIIAIPVILPCKNCQEHATAYIEKHYNEIDTACSSRDSLFKFFVDFHNEVNKKKDKPVMSYEDAYKLYSGKVKITKITYT